MQVNPVMEPNRSLNSYWHGGELEELDAKISEDFSGRMKLYEDSLPEDPNGREDESEEEEEEQGEDEEDDFSFMCYAADNSPISAEDAFDKGQIRPIFPIFNRELLFSDYGSESMSSRLPIRPPVKKVFVETNDPPPPSTPEGDEIDDIAVGPYCEWNKKAVEASPEICKKSNSTGFSKLWRFRDLVGRSNSDGRDAFVFLNDSTAATEKRKEKKQDKVVEKSHDAPEKNSAGDAKATENLTRIKVKTKKGVKSGKALSAHELYLKNKTKDGDRRRSYLPYKPELFGFFTNVNGGMSRNVHPF